MENKIDYNNFVYTYSKKSKNYRKDFRNYQKPLKLFKDLKDDEVIPKEVLKSQKRLKYELTEINVVGNKSPDQKNTIDNLDNFFNFREKVIDLFREYSLLQSEAK